MKARDRRPAKASKPDRCEVRMNPETRAALAEIRAALPGVSEAGAVRYAIIRVSRELSGARPAEARR